MDYGRENEVSEANHKIQEQVHETKRAVCRKIKKNEDSSSVCKDSKNKL
jgi:hypothetical protein